MDTKSRAIPPVSPSLTDRQSYILQVLAATFSSISVASAFLTFYWFRRMRRSFRHDLIMFFILSDMFKALIALISAIVVLLHGPISNTSSFCSASGFLLALGIEASDFAVLMIALHSALSVFRAKSETVAGNGGLYPYRLIAFPLWIVFPTLMASLAFLNPNASYVLQGAYCYLPVQPTLYSRALSWVPRYIIFVTIILIYTSMYVYVRYKLRDLRTEDKNQENGDSFLSLNMGNPQKPKKRYDLPPTPPLAYHGLIPASRQASIHSSEKCRHTDSIHGIFKLSRPKLHTIGSSSRSLMKSLRHGQSSENVNNDHITFELKDNVGDGLQLSESPEPDAIPTSIISNRATRDTIPVRRVSISLSPRRSIMNFLDFMHAQPHHPSEMSIASTSISQLDLLDSRGRNLAAVEKAKTRSRIRRQLRFLFIYPIVYMGMWIGSFVLYVMQYDVRFVLHPPFALTCLAGAMQASQCAMDCLMFSAREKPWRHIPGSNGGFWESLKFWKSGGKAWRSNLERGPGRTKTQMSLDAAQAYTRRNEEIQARRAQMENYQWDAEGLRNERHWWEEIGGDGTMSAGDHETDGQNRTQRSMEWEKLILRPQRTKVRVCSLPANL